MAADAAVGRDADVFGSLASCQARLAALEMNIDLAQEALTCPGGESLIVSDHKRKQDCLYIYTHSYIASG